MTFELWETESGNVIGGYETADAALEVVRATIAAHGRRAVETWLLIREDRRGNSKALEQGAALADRALKRIPA